MRYDLRALRRFLIFALPLLILTMGLFHFLLEMLRQAPDPAVLSRSGVASLPGWVVLATWILEAVGLAALYLLILGRGGSRWAAGLLAGVDRLGLPRPAAGGDRGRARRPPPRPWWALAFSWWILYTLCGLVLGAAASASRLQP